MQVVCLHLKIPWCTCKPVFGFLTAVSSNFVKVHVLNKALHVGDLAGLIGFTLNHRH